MRNKIFQDILNEKNLSLKEASKILKISPLILKDYRDGYLLLDDEKVIEFSKKLDFDPNRLLSDELNYPVRLEVEHDKNKVVEYLKHIFSSIYTFIFSLILVIISCFSIPYSNYQIRDIETNPLKRYNEEFISLYNTLVEEDDITLMPFINALYCPTAYEHSTTFENEDTVKFLIATDPKLVDLFCYRYESEASDERMDIFSLSEDETFFIEYHYVYENRNFEVLSDYTKDGEFINTYVKELYTNHKLKDDDPLIKIGEEKFKASFNKVSSYFTSVLKEEFNINSDFVEFSKNYIINMSAVSISRNSYYAMEIIFSIFLFIFGTIALFTLTWVILKHFHLDIIDEVIDEKDIFEGFNLSKDVSLKRNFKFGPQFRSGLLRIIGLILLFIGNSSLVVIFITLENPEWLDILNSIHYQELFSAFKFIATFLLGFILIDITRKNKNMFLKVFSLLVGGFGFYIFEIITINYLTNAGLLTAIISEFMPLNILWSTGIYVFLSIFLFTTPKFCNKRWKVITFRCASLIPLTFLIGSELISLLSDLGYIVIEKYYHGLLVHKSYGLSTFIILYIYFIYIYELYLKSKFEKNEFYTYITGNKYAWTRNIIAIASLVIAYLVVFTLSFYFKDFEKDFNNIKYILVLIPVLLLYRPRIPKDNLIENVLYTIGLSLAMVSPFVVCFLMLL